MPVDAQRLLVVGRLHGLTRRRLQLLLRQAGLTLAQRPSARVTLVALAHGTASAVVSGSLARAVPSGARLISEFELRRRLGVAPPAPSQERTLNAWDLCRLSKLDEASLEWLRLYDVVEPAGELYGFRDLVAAREVSRLRAQGIALDAIIEAAVVLRRHGLGLSETRLAEGPMGEMLQEVAGRLSELGGQYRLPLDGAIESADDVFARAESAEQAGQLPEAERWYRISLAIDRSDPVIPFNLGNVLRAQGRAGEAAIAWRMATARDPSFADAWFNLGVGAEDAGSSGAAIAFYGRALEADPIYADAAFNLGYLLTRLERFAEAAPIWERFLILEPRSEAARMARRYAALCRLQARK
jgi:tetratricopeptide (TPR) repeat protein